MSSIGTYLNTIFNLSNFNSLHRYPRNLPMEEPYSNSNICSCCEFNLFWKSDIWHRINISSFAYVRIKEFIDIAQSGNEKSNIEE